MTLLLMLKEFLKKDLDISASLKIKNRFSECHLTIDKGVIKLNFPGALNALAFFIKSKFLKRKKYFFNTLKDGHFKKMIICIYNFKVFSINF